MQVEWFSLRCTGLLSKDYVGDLLMSKHVVEMLVLNDEELFFDAVVESVGNSFDFTFVDEDVLDASLDVSLDMSDWLSLDADVLVSFAGCSCVSFDVCDDEDFEFSIVLTSTSLLSALSRRMCSEVVAFIIK